MDLLLSYYPQVLLMVLARVVAVVGGTIIFGKNLTMMQARVLLAFAMTLVLAPLVPPEWARVASGLNSLPGLALAMFGELLLGVAIALICDLFVEIFMMAGQIFGFSSSLTMSQAIDPINGVNNNILMLIFQLLFLMFLWSQDAHLVMIRLLYESFQAVPPTLAWLDVPLIDTLVSLAGLIFSWGVQLALPVMAGVLLFDVGLGLISKMAPGFNILFLSLPLRLGIGLAIMGMWLRYGASPINEVMTTMLDYCARLMG